eukprot:TRINITY_DN94_c3_g1_i1.p1 TRINITY_DN94_c3_g1~~TRINITY_DN94_c3_g1_i1.p1  ORF type:complete len:295 (+),score=53.71 TRINITY_DN94_c3_g1_i1:52-936(+)
MTTTSSTYDEQLQLDLLDTFVSQFSDTEILGEREWMKGAREELNAKPFVVKSLLSKEECEFLMNGIDYKEDLQWKEADGEGDHAMYRKNLRSQVNHEAFTEFLFSRIKKYLPETFVIPAGVKELGGMSEGTWHLQGLNSSVRFCKYTAGGVFKPHYDGLFMTGINDRSLITLMFYLNGDLDGGSTNFLEDPDPASPKAKPPLVQEIAPSQGLCICFPHNMYHEGEPLRSGEKYILRTDVMYHRVPSETQGEQSKLEEADALMRLAQDFERSKQPEEAVKCYRRAFKLNPELGFL